MPIANDIADLTPDRETRITFDSYRRKVLQSAWAHDRQAGEMHRVPAHALVVGDIPRTVTYLPGVGMRMRSYHDDPHAVFELAGGVGSDLINPTKSMLAAGFYEIDLWKAKVLTGVAYTGVPVSGGHALQKRVGPGASWAMRNDADQTAFPSPFPGDDIVDLDRVLVTYDVHNPTVGLQFWFVVPSVQANGMGPIATIYFTGPAGGSALFRGYGQYAAKFFGSGIAKLYERGRNIESGVDVWARRDEFQFSLVMAPGQWCGVTIESNTHEDCSTGEWNGSRIVFGSIAPGSGFLASTLSMLRSLAISVISGMEQAFDARKGTHIYSVPIYPGAVVHDAPVRLDIRRDARVIVSALNLKYITAGTFDEETITLPFRAMPPPSGVDDEPITIEWYGNTPYATTLTAAIHDAETGDELPDGETTITDCLGGQRVYPTPAGGYRKIFVRYTFAGTGTNSAILTHRRIYRDAVTEEPDGDEITIDSGETRDDGTLLSRSWSDISCEGPSEDAQGDTAAFTIADFAPEDDSIQIKAGTPIKLAVYRPSDDTLLSILHRGILGRPMITPMTGDDDADGYPGPGNASIRHTSMGEFARLRRRLAPERMALWDQEAQKPMKVTDVVVWLLKNAGESVMDVPDLPIRLFGVQQEHLIIEPSTPVADLIQQLLFDYLSAYLIFDPNSGSERDGMWRVVRRPKPPYRTLARFTREHPGASKLSTDLDAYGTSTIDGRTVGHIPILSINGQPSERRTVEAPEGNRVTVYGSAPNGSIVTATQGAAQLTQTAWNTKSYNVLNLNPGDDGYPVSTGNPEYLGEEVPIEVFDASLNTQGAVDWVCRRISEFAFPSRTRLTFIAPLVFIADEDDPYQINPRPLRFGDCVQVLNRDGVTWDDYVVSKVSPTYGHDVMQIAVYDLVTTTRVSEYHTPVSSLSKLKVGKVLGARAARTATGQPAHSGRGFALNRQMSIGHSTWMGLPTLDAPEIQNMDPDSATFGDFLTMMDYE